MKEFTATTLPKAIRKLFELNNFKVDEHIELHGAEIDLVAHPLSNPFGSPVYIEATVEYVNNDKYGKDVGKLAMVARLVSGAQLLIVSSKGFSAPIKERAGKTGIITLTYEELFKKFESFEPYIASLIGTGEKGDELRSLNEVYEEPYFEDQRGHELASSYLTNWRTSKDDRKGWLLVVGEYGTGKTALTKILQYRWLQDYKTNPELPLPIRIELKNFSRQFDAQGLLHHFLDQHNLSHISINFVWELIRSGRIILLLDGYDEMAQYLHARERRSCLEALAQLSSDGAKGMLTSRPNYFTEKEEFQVFEALYTTLKHEQYYLTAQNEALLQREQQVDQLLKQFIDRFERILKDLNPAQTEALISRVLAQDVTGRDIVLSILRRIFRTSDSGDNISLSGKPVIISYLLQVVESLKQSDQGDQADALTEWQVYKLIIDQLMIRDLQRSPEVSPGDRRRFLSKLALFLSRKEHAAAGELDFKELIAREFKRELNVLDPEARINQLERLFADLRSSATLTKAKQASKDGWEFSHNTLREYLVTEYILRGLRGSDVVSNQVPITDAMRAFAASRSLSDKQQSVTDLIKVWKTHDAERGRGQLLSLLWEGLMPLFETKSDPAQALLATVTGTPIALNSTSLTWLRISTEQRPADLKSANFSGSSLSDVELSGADLSNSSFQSTTLENVIFVGSDLVGANFRRAFIVEANFGNCNLREADFREIKSEDISILISATGSLRMTVRLDGINALGYLKFKGAHTDAVPQLAVLQHHPRFPIADKILEKLAEQSVRQRRGLEQRGAAREDIQFAKSFMRHLEGKGIIRDPKKKGESLVEVTDYGRTILSKYTAHRELDDVIVEFFT